MENNMKIGINCKKGKFQVTAGFFMLNIVFIIVVLVLQLQKDCLHIEWPLGPKFNHTVRVCNGDTKDEVWKVTRYNILPF